jgi:Cu2+-exporting ATPase
MAVVLSDRAGAWALFTFAEEIRPGAAAVLRSLREDGIERAALLSGDTARRVERLGARLGFDEARGGMTSAAKLDWVLSRRGGGGGILFVGDGLNDAPTLAAAGASVSFGQAPQLSRLASDFVILGDDLSALPAARRIARRARRLLVQNIGWALGYNIVAVPLAASGHLPPWAAALGMSASSIAVVANAMRLARPLPGAGRSVARVSARVSGGQVLDEPRDAREADDTDHHHGESGREAPARAPSPEADLLGRETRGQEIGQGPEPERGHDGGAASRAAGY